MPALASDSLSATGSVVLTKPATDNVAFVEISGTYGTVTFVFEGSIDGTNYFGLAAVNYADNTVATGTISPTDNTTYGYKLFVEGLGKVRLRATAIASGTVAVTMRSDALVGIVPPMMSNFSGMTFGATAYSSHVTLADNALLKVGTDADLTVGWDGTDIDVLQATPNTSIKWGVNGAGIDHVFYGDTASAALTWDQSADNLIFTGEAAVQGLRAETAGATAITTTRAMTLADSGGHFSVSQASAYDIDLPSPTTGPGCTYFLYLTGAAANAVTVTVAGSAATFVGTITIDGATIVATGSTLTFASGAAALGDSIMVRSIATNLYHVVAIASAAGGITIA